MHFQILYANFIGLIFIENPAYETWSWIGFLIILYFLSNFPNKYLWHDLESLIITTHTCLFNRFWNLDDILAAGQTLISLFGPRVTFKCLFLVPLNQSLSGYVRWSLYTSNAQLLSFLPNIRKWAQVFCYYFTSNIEKLSLKFQNAFAYWHWLLIALFF